MPAKGKPYRSQHRLELDRIEARRRALGVSIDDLAARAGLHRNTYGRMKRSGLAFKRHVKALAMAMRTLESEARRDDELFPFSRGSGPGQPHAEDQPRPLAGGAGPSTGSGAGGVSAGSGPGQRHGSGRTRP